MRFSKAEKMDIVIALAQIIWGLCVIGLIIGAIIGFTIKVNGQQWAAWFPYAMSYTAIFVVSGYAAWLLAIESTEDKKKP